MQTLDLLIAKFKEYKNELNKNDSLNHDTVEGFMTGLKAIPKGSPERGKFITRHMNHGPFLDSLKAHPQGKQVHGMLTAHLNSAANAGFKPGQVKTMVKNDATDTATETLEKGDYGMSETGKVSTAPPPAVAAAPKFKGSDLKVVGRGKLSGPGLKMPPSAPSGFSKTINESYNPDPNMAKEELKCSANGQWSLDKAIKTSFKGHKAALGLGTKTDAKGVTTDTSIDPVTGKVERKKYIDIDLDDKSPGKVNMTKACDEKMSVAKNGQWNIEKAVREPSVGSKSVYHNPSTVEGGAKDMKGRVGDPRHLDRPNLSDTTRHGAERDIPAEGATKWTSGTSSLRPKKHTEFERDTTIDRQTQKPVKWNK